MQKKKPQPKQPKKKPSKKNEFKITRALPEAIEHTTPFEDRLDEFLESRCAESDLTVADIKDIVWNEQESNLLSRAAFIIAGENQKTEIEDILNILSEAWNHFPHKRLNGLSPRDMRTRLEEDELFRPDERSDFYELFEDTFPESVGFKKVGAKEWAWEYPAAYYRGSAMLKELRADHDSTQKIAKEDLSPLDDMKEEMFHEFGPSLAEEFLEKDLLHFDAAIFLAQSAFHDDEDAIGGAQVLDRTVREAKKMFPPEFSLGTDVIPWAMQDNRPFLLLLTGHATLTEKIHGPLRAIPLYEELLVLNPSDNQGIRDTLATAYIKTGQWQEVLNLDEDYPNDLMSGLKVGALLALFKLNRLDEAKKRVGDLEESFGHVFREILKTDHPEPKRAPGGLVTVGGDDEAWLYWDAQGTFWMAAPGSREFLRECLGISQ